MALVFLALKFALIALIYVFLYQIIRAIQLDMGYGLRSGRPGIEVEVPGEEEGGGTRGFPAVMEGGDEGRPPGGAEPGPGLYVVGEHGEFPPGAFFAIDPLTDIVVSLGRGPGNIISIPDPYVSAVHARIVRRGEGYWLEDLGSRNGTFVNGKRVSRAVRLRPGDTITVGDTTFQFRGVR
ncbi:MAG: FHA domain-containing protein [Firmicutes bacterium]|nr:FHA domain-containing protein [Bacillota bacterium]